MDTHAEPAFVGYLRRAQWAYHNLNNAIAPAWGRAQFLSICAGACDSLFESLKNACNCEFKANDTVKSAVNRLPFTRLIQQLRNLDLHRQPIPACDKSMIWMIQASTPSRPMSISSKNNVGVLVKFTGGEPEIIKSRRTISDAKVALGDTVILQCQDGVLGIYDSSIQKHFKVQGILREFIVSAEKLVLSICVPDRDKSYFGLFDSYDQPAML